ncbi:MAG: serine/threonine protein kinase [Myxococcota bacterium]|nr:serine/threonine protein kinase [Myxococcota bacterium]
MTGLVGQVVDDRYRIEEEIGCGAMGMVFRARHVRVGREAAIKVLHGHLMRDPIMVERFEREAAIVARLHHKNLVNVIDVGETADRQRYMVQDLVRGPSLGAIITHSLLAPKRIVHLTKQLLSGLAHAHDAGLVHRDLKPENVIVEVDNFGVEVPRIVDFGIALLRDQSKRLTSTGTILGTPAYMAPEQAQGGAPDPRSDLFALGVIVYEMLAGKQPFDGSSVELVIANMSIDPPRIQDRSHIEVDPLLEAFARKLMARRLRERFASARAALIALELVERDRDAASEMLGLVYERPLDKTVAMLRARAATGPMRPIARSRHWPLLAGAVLILGAALGWHAMRPHKAELIEVLR